MKPRILFISLIIAMIALSCKQTAAPEPQTQQEAAKPTDNQMMIIAKVRIKPGNVADFITAAQTIIKSSNEEEGCIEYQLFQSPYDPSSFVFVEKYVNQAAIDFHFGQTYFKEFGTTIGSWTESPAEIKIYEIASEKTPE